MYLYVYTCFIGQKRYLAQCEKIMLDCHFRRVCNTPRTNTVNTFCTVNCLNRQPQHIYITAVLVYYRY